MIDRRFLPRTLSIVLAVLITAAVTSVSAQDMTFEVGETGAPPAPVADGPPSETLANALRFYQQERYLESSVLFQRVVEGQTNDAPANVQKSQFFLGKCLYHLRFYQSALAVFDEISRQGRAHNFFDQTLQWLAQLASQLPEAADIIEKVGRYGVEQLEEFNREETADLYNQLLFIMGRYKYEQREFADAIDIFGRVASDSRHYIQSRFFEGISHVRLYRARPAISAFRAIVDAVENGDAAGIDDEDRMRDLAYLSLARVYYSASQRQEGEGAEIEVDGRLLGNAVAAWNSIGVGSEYWLDALFEASWALYLADEHSRALGNVHTLFSPYFENTYYPEALVIKAVVFFSACQYDNAEAIVGQFEGRYGPVDESLQAVLAQNEDNTQFYEFLQRVRDGSANLPTEISSIVTSALSDRTLLRHVEYIEVLTAEEERLQRTPEAFQNSSLGARILQDISIAKTFGVDTAGDLARGRYRRIIDELGELMSQMDTVAIETDEARLQGLGSEDSGVQATGGNVEIDEEHVVWPFNGEYWRDELGFYRQQVTNVCGRR